MAHTQHPTPATAIDVACSKSLVATERTRSNDTSHHATLGVTVHRRNGLRSRRINTTPSREASPLSVPRQFIWGVQLSTFPLRLLHPRLYTVHGPPHRSARIERREHTIMKSFTSTTLAMIVLFSGAAVAMPQMGGQLPNGMSGGMMPGQGQPQGMPK